jgi:hypothetical protein
MTRWGFSSLPPRWYFEVTHRRKIARSVPMETAKALRFYIATGYRI